MPRATKIPDEQWEAHKETILSLYKDHTLASVVKTLSGEPYYFRATRCQYPPKLQEWGATKYTRAETWQYIASQVKRRREEGLQSEVWMDGVKIPARKLRKETSRIAVPLEDAITTTPIAPPEGVEIREPPAEVSEESNDTTGAVPTFSKSPASQDLANNLDQLPTLVLFKQPIARVDVKLHLPSVEASGRLAHIICAQLWRFTKPSGHNTETKMQSLDGMIDRLSDAWVIGTYGYCPTKWLQEDQNKRIRSRVEEAIAESELGIALATLENNENWKSKQEKLIGAIYQLSLANEKLINNNLHIGYARALHRCVQDHHLFKWSLSFAKKTDSMQDLIQFAMAVAIKSRNGLWFEELRPLSMMSLEDPCIAYSPRATLLQIAISTPYFNSLSPLLLGKSEIRKPNHYYIPPLIDAIRSNQLDWIKLLLLSCGPEGNIQAHLRKTNLLVHAARAGNYSVINRTLRGGWTLETIDDELGTATSQAAKHTALKLVVWPVSVLDWPFTTKYASKDKQEKRLEAIVSAYKRGKSLDLISNALQNAIIAKNWLNVEILIGAGANLDPRPLNVLGDEASHLREDICAAFSKTHRWPLSTPLQTAVTLGDQELALRFLRKGASVDGRALVGTDETPLQIAARLGNLGMVEILLAHNANIAAPPGLPNVCRTAVRYAIENGNREMLLLFLGDRKKSVDVLEEITYCIECDRVNMLMVLLDHGVAIPRNISIYNDFSKLTISHIPPLRRYKLFDYLVPGAQELSMWGYSELMEPLLLMAGRAGDVEILERLLRYSLSIGCLEIKLTTKTMKSKDLISTQLQLCYVMSRNGWKIKLNPLADIRITGDSDFNIYLSRESQSMVTFQNGTLLFLQDIMEGDQKIVQQVLNTTQESRRIHSYYRRLALHEASQHRVVDLMRQLLSDEYDRNRWLLDHAQTLEMAVGHAPSSVAGVDSQPKEPGELMFSAILSKGIHLRPGRALQYAALNGNWRMVELLLNQRVNPNECGDTPSSPELTLSPALCQAIKKDRFGIAFKLLDAGADLVPWSFESQLDISSRDDQRLPLELAVDKGDIPLVEKILSFGIPVEMSTDAYLQGAMRIAAQKGYLEIAVRLLEAGAEFDRQALDLAAENGRFDIVSLILQNTTHKLKWWLLKPAVTAAHNNGFRNIARYIERQSIDEPWFRNIARDIERQSFDP